jgi:hypothetical protein
MVRQILAKLLPIFLLLVATLVLSVDRAQAQFTLTSLVTTTADPNLQNAWGIAYLP